MHSRIPLRTRWVLVAALASALAAVPATAQTALVSGSFLSFTFSGVGSGASGQPFTYASANPFTITIVDGFNPGDQFQLYDGLTLIGTSTLVTANPNPVCSSGTTCLADSRISRGTFLLGPGSYNFNVVATLSPFGSGGAFIGANVSEALAGSPSTTVPEPGTWALMASGLLAVAGFASRRSRRG